MLQMTPGKFFGATISLTLTPHFWELGIAISGTKAPIGQRFSILYII